MTSVMYAAVLGHLPVLRLLMEHGGDVFYKAKVSHNRQWYPQPTVIQHSTHDTNHVHRVHALPFTLLHMVDP